MPEPWNLPLRISLLAPRAVELTVDEVLLGPPGFLQGISRVLRFVGEDLPEEARSPFRYDEVNRRALDAVVVVPHFLAQGPDGQLLRWVLLRTAPRPPVLLRDPARFQGDSPRGEPLWEVPAGLLEPSEESEEGVRRAAARELEEETGFRLSPSEMAPLGATVYPCPGVIAERQYFFAADLSEALQDAPSLDGSPLEALGELVAVPLASAVAELAKLGPVDAKTELGIRRLKEQYEGA